MDIIICKLLWGYSTWLIRSGKMLLARPVPVCQLLRGYSYFCALIRQSKDQLKTTKITTIIMMRPLIQATALFLFSFTLFGCTAMGTQTVPYDQLSKKYTNSSSRYMDVNGLTIHYRDEGEGPPLVLLHGVASSLHTWDDWVKQLKGRYRIIRLDLPGFGLTGPDSNPDSLSSDYMVSMIDGFVQQLGLDRFFMAGSSLGGFYAWNYAHAHPQKLYKLALVGATGYAQDMPSWLGLASFPGIHWITPHMMPRFMVNQTVKSAYADSDFPSDEVKERYFDFTQRRGNRESYIRHFRLLREMSDNDSLGEKVKEVMVPTLLMWGEEDNWIPLDVMRLFHRDLPYSEYLTYEGIGHLPMEELAVQSARDVNNFFMSEIRKVKDHPQETDIKFYDNQYYNFHMGQNEEL